jgi:hypothetical protein
MIDEVQRSRHAAGLELVDPVNWEPKTLEQPSYDSAVGSAPEGDGVDFASGENLRETRR